MSLSFHITSLAEKQEGSEVMRGIFFILILLYIKRLLVQSPNKFISNKIGINIPSYIEFELSDTHADFLGDGTTNKKI